MEFIAGAAWGIATVWVGMTVLCMLVLALFATDGKKGGR
jgi:hypothetical protein